MRAVETQWWVLELPDEWQAEQDEETIIITDEDAVGEIAITTLQKDDGIVDDSELKEYAEDIELDYGPGIAVEVSDLEGVYYCYQQEGEAIREWYLRYEDLLVLITYVCDVSNAGMDDGAVDEILSTLFIKDGDEEIVEEE
ncbi:hypothetical protein [Oceanicoccus sp. KOV_DT_Chl]|uniref:hypothetical protein n=1 Tax=Oceanicoccus sp. KOV_DT_Chl TaxID=1904639 RepID=UPI000C7E03A1|nr:hypothetical protein [Oceanicoccus sp. KOV_DT_Chl]